MITKFVLTAKGQALFARWQTGVTAQFTKIQIGKGTFTGPDMSEATALVSAVKNLTIVGKTVNEENVYIKAGFSNEGVSTGFNWTEIGLFATDPVHGEILYGYGYDGNNPVFVPAASAGAMSFIFTMNAAIGNATKVTVVIDPTTEYVTKTDHAGYLDDLLIENTLAPADYFMFHDESAGADRKTSWQNFINQMAYYGGGRDFTTTAHVTGRKWTDGKRIWRKVIALDDVISNGGQSDTDSGIEDLEAAVALYGFCRESEGDTTEWRTLPFATPATNNMRTLVTTASGTKITVKCGSAAKMYNGIAVIEYTRINDPDPTPEEEPGYVPSTGPTSEEFEQLKAFVGAAPLSTTAQVVASAINELDTRADSIEDRVSNNEAAVLALQTALGGFSFALDSTDGGLNITYSYTE